MQKQRGKHNPQVLDIPDSSFKRLLEISPTGIYITDIAGKCLYVNPVWCRMSGLTVEEAKGDGWLGAIHPGDRDRIKSGWKQFVSGEIPWSIEYRLINQEGKTTWVIGTADRFSEKKGLKEGVIGVNHDITERKETETRLTVSEEKYRSFFENSIDAILLTSPDGKIHSANPAACKLFERPEEEICKIGRDGIVDISDPGLFKALKKRSDTGSYFGELIMVKKSGKKFPVELSTSIFQGSDGSLLTTMIIRDITARKLYEGRLKASEADLRNSKVSLENLNHHLNDVRENERSQIAMNLHDDLGQRLTSLNLDLAWLKSRIGVQSTGVRKKMEEMSRSIIETIESIREVSSFLRPSILYELGLVSAFTWQLKKFEKQTGIKLHFTHKPEDFRIDDHVSLIVYRVLQESLTNIIRHSEATEVKIVLVCKKKLIHLSIIDNGVGIDQDKINSVASMGIAGLMERVTSVNGTLSITGKKGLGTTIKVSIPLKKNMDHDKSIDN